MQTSLRLSGAWKTACQARQFTRGSSWTVRKCSLKASPMKRKPTSRIASTLCTISVQIAMWTTTSTCSEIRASSACWDTACLVGEFHLCNQSWTRRKSWSRGSLRPNKCWRAKKIWSRTRQVRSSRTPRIRLRMSNQLENQTCHLKKNKPPNLPPKSYE